jgi:hypothetical protein
MNARCENAGQKSAMRGSGTAAYGCVGAGRGTGAKGRRRIGRCRVRPSGLAQQLRMGRAEGRAKVQGCWRILGRTQGSGWEFMAAVIAINEKRIPDRTHRIKLLDFLNFRFFFRWQPHLLHGRVRNRKKGEKDWCQAPGVHPQRVRPHGRLRGLAPISQGGPAAVGVSGLPAFRAELVPTLR